MSCYKVGDIVFETGVDLIDVTSAHRPDTNWSYIDRHGHVHCWYAEGQPAITYRAGVPHTVPSVLWVKDEDRFDEDGEPYSVGHCECRLCGERIEPRYTADTVHQYVAGLRWYRIDGQPVTPDEFAARMRAAKDAVNKDSRDRRP